ncbi:hypothetical protein [Caballeronia sp. LZ034LL]|uniref:hypothetical protein n=1 Tax=Caballeronia sp. LZ034LL TaxID=3038567 RepID=UPI00285912FD|nr:hypothetical protein [Caballeronia sp. LZ034LL]MDR5835374.1 hypothetical protein [Caballeronia sp. LZ034LL]
MSQDLIYIKSPGEQPVGSATTAPNAGGSGWKSTTGAALAVGTFVPAVGLGVLLAKSAYDRFSRPPKSSGNSTPDERDITFYRNHAVTEDEATAKGFAFEPGHPQPQHVYQRHPLAKSNASKMNRFLPLDRFADTLYNERKAELMRILVDLGATRVSSIVERSDKSEQSGKASAKVDHPAFSASFDAEARKRSESATSEEEVIELEGKSWKRGDRLNREDYSWLAFEPEWEQIVNLREVGGCKTAKVRLEASTVRTTRFEISANLERKVVNAKFGAGGAIQTSTQSTRTLEVTFSPLSDASAT